MKKIGKIWTFVIASIALCALAIPIALAQSSDSNQTGQTKERKEWRGGRGNHRGHGGRGMGGFMFEKLNLSDAQKAQIQQINQNFRERTKSLREELRAKRQELHQTNEGNTFNESLATQKLTEMSALQARLMGEEFKHKQEVSAVLTPEQKTQLEQLREQFKSRRGQFGGKRAKGADIQN